MKLVFSFILSLLLSVSFAQEMHHDHPSVHGMLIVGSHKVYVSHLPMFHSPHDYQVLMELKLSDKDKLEYLKVKKADKGKNIFTLVPESFVLPEMVKNPRPFKAKIFLGHFERGGKPISKMIDVEISDVVFFKKFNVKDVKPVKPQYIFWGNEFEAFAAHEITVKPDFDHIVKVKETQELSKQLDNVKFVKQELQKSNIEKSIYLERGDLSF